MHHPLNAAKQRPNNVARELMLTVEVPIEALQQLMSHNKIDTTLVYSRVYDSTVAADYYRAMGQIEGPQDRPVNGEELLALLDVLQSGTLDETQEQAAQALRASILSLNMANVSCVDDIGSSTTLV